VVQLDDTEGGEKIVVLHKAGATIELKEDNTINIISTNTNTNAPAAMIELKEDNTINITCDKLTIKADVTMDGEVQITDNTTIEGDLTVGTTRSTTISGNEIRGG
jgi:phage gp45-like